MIRCRSWLVQRAPCLQAAVKAPRSGRRKRPAARRQLTTNRRSLEKGERNRLPASCFSADGDLPAVARPAVARPTCWPCLPILVGRTSQTARLLVRPLQSRLPACWCPPQHDASLKVGREARLLFQIPLVHACAHMSTSRSKRNMEKPKKPGFSKNPGFCRGSFVSDGPQAYNPETRPASLTYLFINDGAYRGRRPTRLLSKTVGAGCRIGSPWIGGCSGADHETT